MALRANGNRFGRQAMQARRNSEDCERTVDEQKAHVEGPNAAQHKVGDVIAGVDRSIGDRGEDRDGAGGEENGAFAYRANIGAINKQRAVKPHGVFHCPCSSVRENQIAATAGTQLLPASCATVN